MKSKSVLAFGLLGFFVAIFIYESGLYPYLRSIFRPIRPSIYETRSDDIFIGNSKAKGTVLLVHGMNFEASKMVPLGSEFSHLGFEVFIPRLAGHRGLKSETHEYASDKWTEQVMNWNQKFRKQKVCAGFSLGGLLLVDAYMRGHVDCDGFVLFAPALALRTPVPLAEMVEKLWPLKLSIPSGIPDEYKHFSTLGLGPTFSALHMVKNLKDVLEEGPKLNLPPALIFMDLKDEVVHAEEVENLAKSIPGWTLHKVNVVDTRDNHAFHLIIDELHLGPSQWLNVKTAIRDFLLGEKLTERRVLEARTE